jgi:hypothetical protein
MNGAYIRRSLHAAFRTATFDMDALSDFDRSFEGFFRSFLALPLCVPIYAVIMLAEYRIGVAASGNADADPVTQAYYFAEAIAYFVNWFAFPLAMIPISKFVGVGTRYVPYVIAYNWGTCVVLAATAIPYFLMLLGVFSQDVAVLLGYSVAIFVLVFRWMLARDALGIPGITALSIVLIDTLMSLLITLGITSLA